MNEVFVLQSVTLDKIQKMASFDYHENGIIQERLLFLSVQLQQFFVSLVLLF